MLTIETGGSVRTCQGISRRTALRIGALGGLSLPWLMHQRVTAATEDRCVKDTAVVLLTLNGGPSQFETFDPKMEAPSEIRSVTGEVQTTLPGITFGGTFPRLAQLAHKLAIVRSFGTYNGDHDLSRLTRRVPGEGKGEAPSWGSLYSRVTGALRPDSGVPTYALLNSVVFDPKLNRHRAAEFTGTFVKAAEPGGLGAGFAPFYPAGGGPLMENMTLRMPLDQFGDRRELLTRLDRVLRTVEQTGELDRMDKFREKAFDVITRGAVHAFDLDREDPATLALYDTSEYHLTRTRSDVQLLNYTPKHLGRQLLLARRLCEAGCGFVMVDCFGWDMHGETISDQFGMHEGMNALGYAVDKAVAGFITDCEMRGLGKKIMLVVTGEMGRTPQINNLGGGRDHWGEITPLLIYGGGLKMGQVVGQSDRQGAKPTTTPFNTEHLGATIMHVLFDGSQVRLRQDLPRELIQLSSVSTPIEPLIG